MITGISTASFFLRQSTEEAAATIQSLGAATAEVFYQTFYEYRPEFSRALAPKIAGLNVQSVHTLSNNFEPQLFSSGRRARGDGFYWLDQVMSSARLLGCHAYTFHGMTAVGWTPDVGMLADRLNEAIAFCKTYGVQLCLENVAWCMYNRPGLFRELKARCPDLAAVFDIKQARRSGYPYAMYLEDMSGSISHVHLSDVDEHGGVCLPGRGVYDFTEIFKRLRGAGFDGGVLVEVYPDNYGSFDELKQSLDFLGEIIDKLG